MKSNPTVPPILIHACNCTATDRHSSLESSTTLDTRLHILLLPTIKKRRSIYKYITYFVDIRRSIPSAASNSE